MQFSTEQRSSQTGEPEQPVQHSLIVANHLGFRLRLVWILGFVIDATADLPLDLSEFTECRVPRQLKWQF